MNPKTIQLTNQLTLEYVEQGDVSGPVVICLHGYSDSWKSFQLALPYLPQTIHAFALSQRGHGNSERPQEGYSPKDFATDIALFIDQMNLEAAVIVGHSMGGIIAQRFALDFAQKTRALVLVNSLSTFSNKENVAALYESIMALSDPIVPLFVEEFQRSTVAKPVSESFMQTVVDESLKLPARVWKAVLSGIIDIDYTKEIQAIKKPVLLVWGDQDTFALRKDQDQLLQSIAGARLSVYTDVGHGLHWEEPQRFSKDVEDFLNEVVQ